MKRLAACAASAAVAVLFLVGCTPQQHAYCMSHVPSWWTNTIKVEYCGR